ncbi:NAD(P)-binding domain-containing protein [Chloroflexota bacterium]
MNHNLENKVVCIVGLGYVGLPLAMAFAKALQVIGFDTNNETVKQLNDSESTNAPSINFTSDPNEINRADFFIICVPTPVTKTKDPDLSYIKSAAVTIGQKMKEGSVVILESTVYPGVTEEVLKPILGRESSLRCRNNFKIGYSPERINPGNEEHGIDKITKVVAGIYLSLNPAQLKRNIDSSLETLYRTYEQKNNGRTADPMKKQLPRTVTNYMIERPPVGLPT